MTISKKKILFITNPISGGHHKVKIMKAIPKLLDKNRFDISVVHTKRAGHATEIAKKAVEQGVDIVVAVGGDGTINEVASQLVNTDTTLAIVPYGSGNGLARDLEIPLHYKKAIRKINSLETKKIDVGVCNDQYFFSSAGIGFDAKVAHDFNRRKKRKFWGYARAIFSGYFFSKDQPYQIELENEKITDTFFFITIANCSQWGYNVRVAPSAKLDNGVFVVNLCKKPPFFPSAWFVIKVLSGKIHTSKYNTFKTCKKIAVSSHDKFYYHLDGDAKGFSPKIEIDILPQALNIVSS